MAKRLNEEYNGWKNWATWYANMILGDDQYTLEELAQNSNYDTYDFSLALKSHFYEIVLGDISDGSLAYEYAEYGLEQIDFYELAETYLMDIEPVEESFSRKRVNGRKRKLREYYTRDTGTSIDSYDLASAICSQAGSGFNVNNVEKGVYHLISMCENEYNSGYFRDFLEALARAFNCA